MPSITESRCNRERAKARERYAARVAQGLCGACGKRAGVVVGGYCDVCRRRQRGYRTSAEARARYAEKLRAIRAAWKAQGLCSRCGQQPATTGRGHCSDCHRASQKRYAENLARGCIDCGSSAVRPGHVRCERCIARYRQAYQRSRAAVLTAYGGKCNCPGCNITEPDFLQIDHVNNDGAAHRRKIGSNIYRWLVKHDFPEGFQLLCANCNFAKGHYGSCPHTR